MGESKKEDLRLEDQILGESSQLFKLSTALEFSEAALLLAQQAKRSIQIFSNDLEGPVYNHEAFIKALVKVAHYHRRSMVQILVRDTSPAVKEGHRLIAMCQQFSSNVQVRCIAEDFKNNREAFLVADQVGFLFRNEYDRYLGKVNFNDAREAGKLLRLFDEAWERGSSTSGIRRLFI